MDKISDLKNIIISTLDSNKAIDIVSIDLKNKSSIADLMIIANTSDGAETTDHYSMMGFTKAYNTAKKTCS